MIPTVKEISELLKSVGKPGEKQEEKKQAVKDLFDERGVRSNNPQGHSVADTLSSYPEF